MNEINYNLTRSKRKNVAIYIRSGIVDVRAPLKMPKYEIDKFISLKEKWITDKLALSVQQKVRQKRFTLDYGDIVICRNKPHIITAQICDDHWYDDEHFYIPPGLTPDEIRCACVNLYIRIARCVLTDKTQKFAGSMSVIPAGIKIGSAKSQWGSCSAKKKINYSWLLIMADDEVIDYVVVHELAHLMEMNHSKRFWSIVGSMIPDYKNRKKRLRELQNRLSGENWD